MSNIPMDYRLDPLTGRPYDVIDPRVVEMLYRADPGWFLQSFAGCLYYLSTVARSTRPSDTPSSLTFRLDCPEGKSAATYAHSYARWAASSDADPIRSMVFLSNKNGNPELRQTVKKVISEARLASSRNVPIEQIKTMMRKLLIQPFDKPHASLVATWEEAVMDCPESMQDIWLLALMQFVPEDRNEVNALPKGPQRSIMPMALDPTDLCPQITLQHRNENEKIRRSNQALYHDFGRYYFLRRHISLPQLYLLGHGMRGIPPFDPFCSDVETGKRYGLPQLHQSHPAYNQWRKVIEMSHQSRRPLTLRVNMARIEVAGVYSRGEDAAVSSTASSAVQQDVGAAAPFRAPVARMTPIVHLTQDSRSFDELMEDDRYEAEDGVHLLDAGSDFNYELMMRNAQLQAAEKLDFEIRSASENQEEDGRKAVTLARYRTMVPSDDWK